MAVAIKTPVDIPGLYESFLFPHISIRSASIKRLVLLFVSLIVHLNDGISNIYYKIFYLLYFMSANFPLPLIFPVIRL